MSETAALEAQETEVWCWVAATRMFAMHYATNGVPDHRTQRNAVAHVYNLRITDPSLNDLGGSIDSDEIAIHYYLGIDITRDQNGNIDYDDFITYGDGDNVYTL